MQKILISSCLLGESVRYNGKDARVESGIIDSWIAEGRVVSVCPEMSSGLGVPRRPAEIIGTGGFAVLDGFGVVLDDRGNEITQQFVSGAQEALRLAKSFGVKVAVLKDGSPSCGRTYIHNGRFNDVKKRGEVGVTAALLQRQGIAVFSERQIVEAERLLKDLEMNRRMGA
jgi:uncharacterized protein YbbK (DUF523 family)